MTCFCLTPQTEFSLHEPTAGSHDYSLFWSCVCDLFLFGVCVGVGGVVLSVCVCVCVTCFSLTSQAEFSLHEPTAGSHAGSHEYSPTHSYAELRGVPMAASIMFAGLTGHVSLPPIYASMKRVGCICIIKCIYYSPTHTYIFSPWQSLLCSHGCWATFRYRLSNVIT